MDFHGPKRTKTPLPLSRVELHIHLDGSVRPSTVWDLSKSKGLPLPGTGSLQDLTTALRQLQPATLTEFLTGFVHSAPAIAGDLEAVERVSLEFCEDAANNGLLYVEARFCPHFWLKEGETDITVDDVVETVLKGFKLGEEQFGVTARVLLCCIRGLDQFSEDVLRLCDKYRDKGVVGIDIAGDEEGLKAGDPELFSPSDIKVFEKAKRLGINRTVHAGEVGPPDCVREALDSLHAMRIGHGYAVQKDADLYARCLREKVHFETCPTSSLLTGAVPLNTFYHPIVKFAEDGANFSINTDDSFVTGTWTQQEYSLLSSWGLSEAHLVRANVNAMKAAFVPEEEKKVLLGRLYKAYGIEVDV